MVPLGEERVSPSADDRRAKNSLASGIVFDSTVPVESLQRRAWAQQYLERAGCPLPIYGSEAWTVLPLNDPARIAACVVAAECWAREGDELPERLARELENRRGAEARLDAHEWGTIASRVRARSNVVDFAERTRRLREAAKPRPGDYPGRGGRW